jgi:hypothetical protein
VGLDELVISPTCYAPACFSTTISIFRLSLLVNWLAGLTKNLQSTSACFNLNHLTASSVSGFWFIWGSFSFSCFITVFILG